MTMQLVAGAMHAGQPRKVVQNRQQRQTANLFPDSYLGGKDDLYRIRVGDWRITWI